MDRYLLEYHMKSKGISTAEFCESIGMSATTYYRKVNGESEFTLAEIKKTAEILDIKDIRPIFFADEVSETTPKEDT